MRTIIIAMSIMFLLGGCGTSGSEDLSAQFWSGAFWLFTLLMLAIGIGSLFKKQWTAAIIWIILALLLPGLIGLGYKSFTSSMQKESIARQQRLEQQKIEQQKAEAVRVEAEKRENSITRYSEGEYEIDVPIGGTKWIMLVTKRVGGSITWHIDIEKDKEGLLTVQGIEEAKIIPQGKGYLNYPYRNPVILKIVPTKGPMKVRIVVKEIENQ